MIGIAKPLVGDKEKELVNEVLNSGMLAQGPKVKALEETFAGVCGTSHAVATNSGTSALHCGLYALGVKCCDEVVTTPFTFVATSNPVIMQQGKVKFCDIEEDYFNLSTDALKEAVTENTKAVIPVDLYGHPSDYDEIRKITDPLGVTLLEDACQAVGSTYKGKVAGSLGDIGAFSFYATKNIITGEGGIMTTSKEEYSDAARMFRHHGQSEKTRYEYHDLGYNYRMMDLQAAIALAQLERLEDFSNKRRANAAKFDEAFKGIDGLVTPPVMQDVVHVYHQYTIRITEQCSIARDDFVAKMRENGVGVGVYYPKPLHLHKFYREMGYKEGDFPVAERVSKECVSLPVHPGLSEEEVQTVIDNVLALAK